MIGKALYDVINEELEKTTKIIEDRTGLALHLHYTVTHEYTRGRLLKAVESTVGVSYEEMSTRSRITEVVAARQLFFYFMRQRKVRTNLGIIAAEFGVHHTTVMYSITRVKCLLKEKDATTLNYIKSISIKLGL